MEPEHNRINVYLEYGKKRTFAGAIDWPGWVRSGRDERDALQVLRSYAERYARVLKDTNLGFFIPVGSGAFEVIECFEGTTSTDFGVPDLAPSADASLVSAVELERFESLLVACWRKFDETVRTAGGKELRKGPRGGGRDVGQIADHVNGAEVAYLSRLGISLDPQAAQDVDIIRKTVLDGLSSAARGEIPERGPRGGKRWGPRYFVRRVAWHVLDHAWEIEDRLE